MSRQKHIPIAKQWDSRACRISNPVLEKDGDFFIVKGKVMNITSYALPHLQLRVSIYSAENRLLLRDDFHLSDRKLLPGRPADFKLEGEWREGMSRVRVDVCPHPSKFNPNIAPSSRIKIREIDSYRDELILGEKRMSLQTGDLVFVKADDVTDETILFGGIVKLLTRSPFYHMIIYDHGGRFVHAGWPKVEVNNLWRIFLRKPNISLFWGRPLHHNGREVAAEEGARAVAFAKREIGKRYDIGANISYLFRSDGMQKTPMILRKVFDNNNYFRNRRRWQCSGIVCAAWYDAAGILFGDNINDITYLSPADIYESIYCKLLCTLEIIHGEARLLTKRTVAAKFNFDYEHKKEMLVN